MFVFILNPELMLPWMSPVWSDSFLHTGVLIHCSGLSFSDLLCLAVLRLPLLLLRLHSAKDSGLTHLKHTDYSPGSSQPWLGSPWTSEIKVWRALEHSHIMQWELCKLFRQPNQYFFSENRRLEHSSVCLSNPAEFCSNPAPTHKPSSLNDLISWIRCV